MKNRTGLFAIVLIVLLFASCKKDLTPNTAQGNQTGRSLSVLTEYAVLPDGKTAKNRFVLLNIDFADNTDKQYMVVDLIKDGSGTYKFEVKESASPIKKLASNWPAQVRRVVSGRGYGNDFSVNAYMSMRAQGISRPYTFTYDSIHHFTPLSSVIYPINWMHTTMYAGSMAGKDPQASVEIWGPGQPISGGSNTPNTDSSFIGVFYTNTTSVSIPYTLYFYFDEGYFTNVSIPGLGAGPFSKMIYNGDPLIDKMKDKVDAAIAYQGNTSVLFFFDFDKWEYFTVTFPCPSVHSAPCTGTIETSAIKSMNTLLDWPVGWGTN